MPVLAIFALVLLARPALRRRAGLALPILSAGLGLATYLAMRSGQELRELLGDFAPNTDKHESLANTTLLLILLLVATSGAMAAIDGLARTSAPRWLSLAPAVLLAVSFVLASLATIWMFRTGHEGARLVWKGTVQSMAVLTGYS